MIYLFSKGRDWFGACHHLTHAGRLSDVNPGAGGGTPAHSPGGGKRRRSDGAAPLPALLPCPTALRPQGSAFCAVPNSVPSLSSQIQSPRCPVLVSATSGDLCGDYGGRRSGQALPPSPLLHIRATLSLFFQNRTFRSRDVITL